MKRSKTFFFSVVSHSSPRNHDPKLIYLENERTDKVFVFIIMCFYFYYYFFIIITIFLGDGKTLEEKDPDGSLTN